ncbi:MAG TPA: disulfide bond formation protein B, partial [Methylophaga sp.]|nr:disulfide bond formation protein B [Methylophaga sp.]
SWTFLTLSIPAWTLLTFVGMLGLAIAAAWRQH